MQSIKEILEKIKTKGKVITENTAIFSTLIIVTVAFSSFGLGRLSKTEANKTPLSSQIIQNNNIATISETIGNTPKSAEVEPPQISQEGRKYVGSINSDKYHAPWCSGAKRINEENQIWFATKAEAEKAGYTPASNCKGI